MSSQLTTPSIRTIIAAAAEDVSLEAPKVLLIGGYKFQDGVTKAAPKTLYEHVDSKKADGLFGSKSLVTYAIKKFKKINGLNQLDVIGLKYPDGGTGAATSLVVSGTAEESGELEFRLFDDEFKIKVQVIKGQEAVEIAANILKAFAAADYEYPFEAILDNTDNTNKTLKITTSIIGMHLDGCWIRIWNKISGLNIETSPADGGSGAYDVSGLKDQILKRYRYIVFDATVDISTISELLEARMSVPSQILTGIGITTHNITLAGSIVEALTDTSKLSALGNPTETIVYFCNNTPPNLDMDSKSRFNLIPLLHSIEMAAIFALRLTEGSDISKYVISPLEVLGGIGKASLPYKNTPISYLNPYNDLEISQTDCESLNKLGINIIGAMGATGPVLREVNTMYKKDQGGGVINYKFQQLMTMDMIYAIQEYLQKGVGTYLSQVRYIDGEIIGSFANKAVVNATLVRSRVLKYYSLFNDLLIVQTGVEAYSTFINSLKITKDAATKTLNIGFTLVLPTSIENINMAIIFDVA